ncbi:CHAD domain-containing protein [Tahibacter caeni]|uniref:CHAD domain-containing protein n=1 Tax=Tahibacter caeni TaxID=1453545 RepID=UPI00214921A9|nr:CHAD domain-containing protein [Tahibacter caeni]
MPPEDSSGASDLGTALQAYALAQLYRIGEHLKRHRHPHGAVHEARKAVRRFRSVIALCRSAAPELVDAADATIRRVGKRLSRLRDAHVATETVAGLRHHAEHGDAWRALHAALKQERDTRLEAMLADDPGFAGLRKRVLRVARTVAGAQFTSLADETVLLALRASAARMQKAERDARERPGAALRHRWRRRVRRLRLQLECLEEIARDGLPAVRAKARWVLSEALETMPSVVTLERLADRLGRQQDLVNLRAALRRNDALPSRDVLLRALTQRRTS